MEVVTHYYEVIPQYYESEWKRSGFSSTSSNGSENKFYTINSSDPELFLWDKVSEE